MGTLHEEVCTITIISRSGIFRMRNVSDKFVEKIQTYIYIQYPFSENRAVYEIMWKNIAEADRPQVTIWQMCFASYITKATNTGSECVILIVFRWQQWLHERDPMLR